MELSLPLPRRPVRGGAGVTGGSEIVAGLNFFVGLVLDLDSS